MENNMQELSPEMMELISGGELTEMDKIAINRHVKSWKSQGFKLRMVKSLLCEASPEVIQYVEEHWDSY